MARDDVAVVGMACVLPGAADLSAYWRNLVNGVDAVSDLPAGRWPGSRNMELPAGHAAHIPCRRGGFLPGPFLFDSLRFKVMPRVAADGDVDQFILLHVIADALEDAGIGADDPCRVNTDVIVGRGGYTSNRMMEIFMRGDLLDRLRQFLSRRLPGVGDAELDRLEEEMKASLPELDADGMASSIPNLVASRPANRLNLRGAAYCVDAACASSLIAVEQAMRRLRDGLCDVALACGVNFTQVPAFWYLFSKILALSPSGRIRPFHREADGLIIGEGAGVVVLRRLEDARRHGDRVYAVVRGAGSASDGAEVGLLAPSPAGQIKALEQAYGDAGVEPDSIGFLEAHGTGTVQGDGCELESIKEVFGKRKTIHATRVMGSVKSMIGHAMPAAGIASFIKTALTVSNKILPPSLHCEQPHPDLEEAPFYVSGEVRPWIHPTGTFPRRAAINAFGFGGINSHVIVEEVEAVDSAVQVAPGAAALAMGGHSAAAPAVGGNATAAGGRSGTGTEEPLPSLLPRPHVCGLRRPSELLVFSGETVQVVVERIRRLRAFLRHDQQKPSLEDLAYTLSQEFDFAGSCKLAVLVTDVSAIDGKLAALEDQLPDESYTGNGYEGIFLGRHCSRPLGKVAGVFPGLSFPGLVGHYPDHLMSLCMRFPGSRRAFDAVESRDHHPEDLLPTSFLLQPPGHLSADERKRLRQRFTVTMDEEGRRRPAWHPWERLLSSAGMLTSNWSGWQLLEPFGIPFEMLCGQSLGDVSALCASGMVDFEEMITRLWRYLDVDLENPGQGCLAFVGTHEARLAAHLEGLTDVQVALHLSPETLIVGGPDGEMTRLARRLKKDNILAQKLPMAPVHTPFMEDIRQEIARREEAHPLPLRPARISVYSPITAAPIPEEQKELWALLTSNMTKPVRLWQTVQKIYADGARVFIQVGTGTLAGNIKSILGDQGIVSVALDVDYRDPMTQIQRLCGTLLTHGVKLNLEPLFTGCEPTFLQLDEPRAAPQPRPGEVPLRFYWPPLQTAEGPETEAAAGEPAAVGPENAPAEETPGARPQAGPAARTLPFIGEVLHLEPEKSIVLQRRFDLAEDLYLADHTFINSLAYKPPQDCFPVVPLTVTLEMLAEAGACLAPGLGLIGLDQVRAHKWIALDGVENLDVRIEAQVVEESDGVTLVQASAHVGDDRMASARVRFAGHYRQSMDLTFSALADQRPFPLSPADLYSERHLFHGPRFQCVTAIKEWGRAGMVGELEVPAYDDFFASGSVSLLLDPVVMDGAGQLVGMTLFGKPLYMMPVAVQAMEFYRPAPAPGTRVPVRVELLEVDLDSRRLRANMEVQDGEGGVWFRVRGWQDIAIGIEKSVIRTQRQPHRYTMAVETVLSDLPAGSVTTILPRHYLKGVETRRLAQLYLNNDEWPGFDAAGPDPRRRRQWLMGRVAVKDAARLWLGRRSGGDSIHPVLLGVDNDSSGRPRVRTPQGYEDVPGVSIAHTEQGAAAIAADMPVGIDVEPFGSSLKLEDFATVAEIGRIRETGRD